MRTKCFFCGRLFCGTPRFFSISILAQLVSSIAALPFCQREGTMNRVLSHRAASTSSAVSCPAAAASSFRARSAPASSLPPKNMQVTISRSPLALTPPRRCSSSSSSSCRSSNDSDNGPSSSPSSAEKDLLSEEDVWAQKPIWCRPYSIIATGLFVVGGAELVGGGWLALAAAAAVAVWWWAFLVEYPVAYRDYVRGTRHAGGFAKSADSEEFESLRE